MNPWRSQFPACTHMEREGLVYLDSAATTQKPGQVIEALLQHLQQPTANVHRSGHRLGRAATDAFEGARERLCRFFGVAQDSRWLWTRGTTEALNLVAQGWAAHHLQPGDEIIISEQEHHANLVPWQMLQSRGIRLKRWPLGEDRRLHPEDLHDLITPKTRLLAVSHASNVLGMLSPLAEIVRLAHDKGVAVVVDGAQAPAHVALDLDELNVDFYAMSGHKMFGPTGIGALVVGAERIRELKPVQFGGEMVAHVTWESSRFQEPPLRHEAGTPPVMAAIGWAAAADWMDANDRQHMRRHEQDLIRRLYAALASRTGIRPLTPTCPDLPILSLTVDGLHPFDLGSSLDEQGFCVRTGMHCAEPLHATLAAEGSLRISLAPYNSNDDIDAFLTALDRTLEMFR